MQNKERTGMGSCSSTTVYVWTVFKNYKAIDMTFRCIDVTSLRLDVTSIHLDITLEVLVQMVWHMYPVA